MGLFSLFKKRAGSSELLENSGQESRPKSVACDGRLVVVHDLIAEARSIDARIPLIDESLVEVKGNWIKERATDERERGKSGKYPRALAFNLYQAGYPGDRGQNGSHGVVYFLKDGTPGKAMFDTWESHVHYHIQAKIINGVLRVSFIDRNVMPEIKGGRVYDYRNAE